MKYFVLLFQQVDHRKPTATMTQGGVSRGGGEGESGGGAASDNSGRKPQQILQILSRAQAQKNESHKTQQPQQHQRKSRTDSPKVKVTAILFRRNMCRVFSKISHETQ